MKQGTRMINGVEFTLFGLDEKNGAMASAKKYRDAGKKVRLIRKSFLHYQIWVSA